MDERGKTTTGDPWRVAGNFFPRTGTEIPKRDGAEREEKNLGQGQELVGKRRKGEDRGEKASQGRERATGLPGDGESQEGQARQADGERQKADNFERRGRRHHRRQKQGDKN